MKIGVIGSGRLGGTAARLFVADGHTVAVANTRGPNSVPELRRETGGRARMGTATEVAIGADVVLLAMPFGRYRDLPVEPFRRKIVIDATNYRRERDGSFADLDADRMTSTGLVARHLERARIVKGFNTMDRETLASGGRPRESRERRLALFLAGDDSEAKAVVATLMEQLGFAAVDTGSLVDGGRLQQPGSPLYNTRLLGLEAATQVAAQRPPACLSARQLGAGENQPFRAVRPWHGWGRFRREFSG